MNTKIFLSFTTVFLCFCVAANAQNNYQYTVDLNKLENDELKVNLVVPKITTGNIIFFMPKTLPGTYMNSDFGKFVRKLKAFDKAGNSLRITALPDSNSWKIENATRLYSLQYNVEDTWDAKFKHRVYEMAGTNFEENKNFSLNTCGIFGYFDGLKKIPFELTFKKPAGFYGSSGLTAVKSNAGEDVFHCENADKLYDSPIMYCIPDTTVIKVGVTDILISVYSPKKLVTSKFIAENMKDLLNAAKNYMGGKLPVNKYAFLYYFNSEQPTVKGQGAWEHSYSSFYSLPELPEKGFIGQIIDVSSHEFFHIVTPLNISSQQVREFNFNKTVLSKHLWLYEGSTEYDAHHTQVTQGLITPKEYLKRLTKKIKMSKYYNDTLPFTALSLGSADVYADQFPNVYQKGALINACLDIYLEKLSGGNYGSRDLKHDLSVKYGPTNYFIDNELFDEITKLTFPEIRTFFAKYVEGNEMLPYGNFFDMVGVKYISTRETTAIGLGGIGIGMNDNKDLEISVTKLDEFGKKMDYKQGDILTGFNGEKVSPINVVQVIERFTANAKEGDTLVVNVKRGSEDVTLSAPAVRVSKSEQHVLEFDTAATAEQLKLRDAWLNTQCRK
jgi:predicted metalloprotease with PDZ domain